MAEKNEAPKEVKLEIHADEQVAQGLYANFAVGNFSESEFMMDFIFVAPGVTRAKVLSRIIMSPAHAKRLANLLNRQVAAFEGRFGAIPEHGTPGFKGRDENGNLVN